ncbi:RNA-binding S4 domain-containing protein [Fusibacter paucivorans]|uniref:RNA-binding S4 domain-containing protein n=1 Tax=Fusibacter paucivorans TaxID=76009 RepID=A0ABS5PQ71_9FIRM|nr:RNA-binding S4 domain-containing protein [Fusibacter paucivorans]MBS7526521.1 RNA-binding S4 domain-containing protein [Fusibacter paucivorans]
MQIVEIKTPFIKLDQLLKYAAIVDSGGFAKLLITEGYVTINQTPCLERGKKVRDGDVVEVIIPNDNGEIETQIVLKIQGR